MERYAEYKDSGIEWIGEIPGHWEVRNAGTIFAESKERGSGLDEILSATQAEGMVPKSQLESVVQNAEDSDLSSFKKVRIGDFVISLRSFQGGLELASKYEGRVTPAYTVLRPRGKVFSGYFKYLYKSNEFIEALDASTSGIREGKTIRYKDFKQLQIPIPIYKEQQSIANYLDEKTHEIDSLIEGIEKSIELLKEYRKAVVSEAVTKGLDSNVPLKDSGIEWVGEIPDHWSVDALGRHSDMLTPMRDKPEMLDGPIPWVRIEDYDGKYIRASKEGLGVSEETIADMNLKVYPINTILCTSSCDLGKCALVAEPLVSNQRFIGIIPREDVNPDFLYYVLLSSAERLNYLSTGTIQANLSRKAFEHLMLAFPPLSEQKEISEYLDHEVEIIETVISESEKQIEAFNEYRKSLISEAVTGKFKVPGVA